MRSTVFCCRTTTCRFYGSEREVQWPQVGPGLSARPGQVVCDGCGFNPDIVRHEV